jgi:hypothetical protein
MSKNLYLNPNSYDLEIQNFNLRMTLNIVEYVAQKIENTLKTFKDEWFLNPDIGIPFYDRILIKQADLNDVNSIFQKAVLDIPEVSELLKFSVETDGEERTYTAELEAQIGEEFVTEETTTGLLTITGIGG